MAKSTGEFTELLAALRRRARARGLTDAAWAKSAGIRKETLSRLSQRQDCDLATLRALAEAVGTRVGLLDGPVFDVTPDGCFPARMDRDYEEKLVGLCASGSVDPPRWASAGPGFFMAGLAVMLASLPGRNRPQLLALADKLHCGASEPAVFSRWLERSPVRPSRFLPLLEADSRHAA